MNIENLDKNLEFLAKPYPGRIVLTGLDETGRYWRQFCAIAGRSEGSQNRIYKSVADGIAQDIETAVYDLNKQKGDPSKTIYPVMMNAGHWHVASNGLQTKSIARDLDLGNSFENALAEWANEGAEADFTARIVTAVSDKNDHVLIGKITRNPLALWNSIYSSYKLTVPSGCGFFITTYNGEGGTIPFTSDPMPISLKGELEDNMEIFWDTFDYKTRVSLVGKEIDKGSGRYRYAPIKNARLGD